MISQSTSVMRIRASRPGLHEITDEISRWLRDQTARSGLLTVFCRHTSASLLIQENAAPAAKRDLERYFGGLAPEGVSYEHDDEGPDDMPAHIRSALTQTHLSIPVAESRLLLGTWQGVYLFEHRKHPPERELALHLIGE